MDKLLSRAAKAPAKLKRRLRQAVSRMRWRVWDLIDELHWKSARFLVDNYDLIFLPTFETSQMSARSDRKIGNESVRSMLTLAHFRFKQRLKYAAKATGKTVLDVCEAYTSKTVSWTGEIKNISGAKTISAGGVRLCRDVNGARGIFLRALGDTPALRSAIVGEQQCSLA